MRVTMPYGNVLQGLPGAPGTAGAGAGTGTSGGGVSPAPAMSFNGT